MRGVWLAPALCLAIALASPALALDSLSPGGGQAASREGEGARCPALTRIKYPFLTCSADAEGRVTLDSTAPLVFPRQMIDPLNYVGGGHCSGEH